MKPPARPMITRDDMRGDPVDQLHPLIRACEQVGDGCGVWASIGLASVKGACAPASMWLVRPDSFAHRRRTNPAT